MNQRTMLRNLYWNMMSRCYAKSHKSYHRYGGRGIKVCSMWRGKMNKFIDWATANGWRPGLTLDRENNDGDYTPKNCRFVGRKTSKHNRDEASAFISASLAQKRRYKKRAERAATSRAVSHSWEKPSRKRKQSSALKEVWQRPDYLQAQSDAKKRQWADPEWRERTIAAIRRAKQRP